MKKQPRTDKLVAHFLDLLLQENSLTKGLSFQQIADAFCCAVFECGTIAGEVEEKMRNTGRKMAG